MGGFHTHSLLGGEVQTVQEVPDDEDGAHEAEDDAVEAQRHHQRKEQKVQHLPELERHLHFPPTVQRSRKRD